MKYIILLIIPFLFSCHTTKISEKISHIDTVSHIREDARTTVIKDTLIPIPAQIIDDTIAADNEVTKPKETHSVLIENNGSHTVVTFDTSGKIFIRTKIDSTNLLVHKLIRVKENIKDSSNHISINSDKQIIKKKVNYGIMIFIVIGLVIIISIFIKMFKL